MSEDVPTNVRNEKVGSDGINRKEEIYCQSDSEPEYYYLYESVTLNKKKVSAEHMPSTSVGNSGDFREDCIFRHAFSHTLHVNTTSHE